MPPRLRTLILKYKNLIDMANTQKPQLKDFSKEQDPQKAFEAALALWTAEQQASAAGADATITENKPSTRKLRARLLDVSPEIVRGSGNPFHMLTLAQADGEVVQMAVNKSFMTRIASQLHPNRPYEWVIETRKAGVTTYKDAKGALQTHTSDGEGITGFSLITERSFDEGTNTDLNRIIGAGDSANAVADYLKTVRTAGTR